MVEVLPTTSVVMLVTDPAHAIPVVVERSGLRTVAYGARDGSQLLEVWRAACRQSGMVALAFALIYSLAGQYIIALLTSLPSLQQLADRYLIWQTILPVVGVPLPFMSYGGTALVTLFLGMGILMSINAHRMLVKQ